VAQRVVFELGRSRFSESWPSVAAYRQARETLATAPTQGGERWRALAEARSLLERALAHDPTNLLARYELGNVLRKLGSNEDAVEQYELLEDFFHERKAPMLLRRTTVYNRAVALSKIGTWPEHGKAVEALERLQDEVTADPKLKASERDHLLALTRSARAAAGLFELEQLRGYDDESSCTRRDELLRQIVDARDWIRAPERRPGANGATYYQALAVAENARGRAIHLVQPQDGEQAVAAFERALSLAPELGDAHVNLADALLRNSPSSSDQERAAEHLERAITMSPRNAKALYLRGKLALAQGDRTRARKEFEGAAAEGDAWAMLGLARLAEQDGDLDAAVSWAQRSLGRAPGANVRVERLVVCAARLASAGGVDRPRLDALRQIGDALEQDAGRRHVALTAEVDGALQAIREASEERRND
jgi:tetratricopeptide (TPR) repeat protein